MTDSKLDLSLAQSTLRAEGTAICALADRLGEDFSAAAEAVYACTGQVVVTGVGKAGIIGRKISGTLASTGTRSIFLHPVEALHGDLGRLGRGDVVIALSHSGASEEIVRLLDHVRARGGRLIGLTGHAESPLGTYADVTLNYGPVEEACPLGLAPTVSTACMLAVGDALALTVMQMRNFTPEDYAAFHPGGSLGRSLLLKVEEAMSFRVGDRLTVIPEQNNLGQALALAEQSGRRAGAMVIVDPDGVLTGILTDGDLRRLLLSKPTEDLLATPIRELMVADPRRVRCGELASRALAIMNEYRIDELPVVDDAGKPAGLIDVQDLLGIQTLSHGK